jgi:hypothetical protein
VTNKHWNHIFSVIEFEEGKNPKFSVMVQNPNIVKKKMHLTVNMQFFDPRSGVQSGYETHRTVTVKPCGASVLVFEWPREIGPGEMHGIKNRNNLFFYFRCVVYAMRGPFKIGERETFCEIYNAWEEPRPAGIPLFVPCGSFTDPLREKDLL